MVAPCTISSIRESNMFRAVLLQNSLPGWLIRDPNSNVTNIALMLLILFPQYAFWGPEEYKEWNYLRQIAMELFEMALWAGPPF